MQQLQTDVQERDKHVAELQSQLQKLALQHESALRQVQLEQQVSSCCSCESCGLLDCREPWTPKSLGCKAQSMRQAHGHKAKLPVCSSQMRQALAQAEAASSWPCLLRALAVSCRACQGPDQWCPLGKALSKALTAHWACLPRVLAMQAVSKQPCAHSPMLTAAGDMAPAGHHTLAALVSSWCVLLPMTAVQFIHVKMCLCVGSLG